MNQWLGPKSAAYIPVTPINDNRFGTPPDFKDKVTQLLLLNPDANGVDVSLRTYFFTVSYGRAALQPTVFDPVTIPDPQATFALGDATGHAVEAAGLANFPAFTTACAVFAPNPGYHWADHAFWNYPAIPGTNVTNYCYDMLDSNVGAWAMELTHMLTFFGDLYSPPGDTLPRPGAFDNMACACGVHPSTFTKLKLGWLDESEIVAAGAGVTTQTLHALSLPRPSPPRRYTAFSIPTSDPQHYFLVEARLRTDAFDAGIPSEGVVVYEVNEATWPPLQLLTPVALGVNESFEDPAFPSFAVTVDAAVSGGFTVEVRVGADPHCPELRAEIAAVQGRIQKVEAELQNPGDLTAQEYAALVATLRALKAELTTLQGDLVRMGCPP
jgi:M6 family metalloprotease-like protein